MNTVLETMSAVGTSVNVIALGGVAARTAPTVTLAPGRTGNFGAVAWLRGLAEPDGARGAEVSMTRYI